MEKMWLLRVRVGRDRLRTLVSAGPEGGRVGVANLEGFRVSVPAREVRLDLRAAASPRSRSAHSRGRRAAVLLLTGALLAQAVSALIPVAAIAAPVDQGITAPVAPAAPTPQITIAPVDGQDRRRYTGFNTSATSPNPRSGPARPAGGLGSDSTALGGDDRRAGGRDPAARPTPPRCNLALGPAQPQRRHRPFPNRSPGRTARRLQRREHPPACTNNPTSSLVTAQGFVLGARDRERPAGAQGLGLSHHGIGR
jgi:hypothetical protein